MSYWTKKNKSKEGGITCSTYFCGITCCTIGVSAQRSTCHDSFTNAVNESFDERLCSKVKFIYSDAPKRIFKAAKLIFPSLVAIGEDPIHLAIRMEYCWGGKRTKPSVRIRQLHQKFRCPTTFAVRFWQPTDVIFSTISWPLNPKADTRTPEEWDNFCKIPFNDVDGYATYVLELAKISVTYKDRMLSKNSDGVTVLKLLKNGASREHYEGLQNSSRLLNRLGTKGIRLGTGTARNEQLHRELKSWMRNIITSHEQRLLNGLRYFVFSKLVTHSSASYFPTLVQISQNRLLFIIANKIRLGPFFPTPVHSLISNELSYSSRNDIKKPLILNNTGTTISRAAKRKREKDMWKLSEITPRVSRRSNTNVFRRPRIDNRIRAFTKKKT